MDRSLNTLYNLYSILSAEMGRDLAIEVEKLFNHKHSYVRKKVVSLYVLTSYFSDLI